MGSMRLVLPLEQQNLCGKRKQQEQSTCDSPACSSMQEEVEGDQSLLVQGLVSSPPRSYGQGEHSLAELQQLLDGTRAQLTDAASAVAAAEAKTAAAEARVASLLAELQNQEEAAAPSSKWHDMLSAQHQWDGKMAGLQQQLTVAQESVSRAGADVCDRAEQLAAADVAAAQKVAAVAEARNTILKLELSDLRKQKLKHVQQVEQLQQENKALREEVGKLSVANLEKDVLLGMQIEEYITSRMTYRSGLALPSGRGLPGMRRAPDVQLTSQAVADTLGEFIADAKKCLEGLGKDESLLRKLLGKVERSEDAVWWLSREHARLAHIASACQLYNRTQAYLVAAERSVVQSRRP